MGKSDDLLEKVQETDDFKSMNVQLFLILGLGSIVLVIKNSILSDKGFVWLECLTLSVSAFILLFMSIYKNKEIYPVWKKRFLERKRAFFFLGLSLLGMFLIVLFNWLMYFIADWVGIFKDQIYDLGFIEINSDVFNLPFLWIADYFSYLFFSMMVVQGMIPISVIVADRVENGNRN